MTLSITNAIFPSTQLFIVYETYPIQYIWKAFFFNSVLFMSMLKLEEGKYDKNPPTLIFWFCRWRPSISEGLRFFLIVSDPTNCFLAQQWLKAQHCLKPESYCWGCDVPLPDILLSPVFHLYWWVVVNILFDHIFVFKPINLVPTSK